jgi:hypothetical protein
MVRVQPSQFSVFVQIILSIIFIISLSGCLFLGKLEYMVVFFAIGLMVLTIYFIKWLIKNHPDFVSVFSGFVQIILLSVFIVGFLVCLYLGEYKLMVVILVIGFVSLILLKLDLGHEPSNATLTCKNGHTCRVWVDLTGREIYYPGNRGMDEMIYTVDGHDFRKKLKVMPVCCPECGAEWQVPNKHNGHK